MVSFLEGLCLFFAVLLLLYYLETNKKESPKTRPGIESKDIVLAKLSTVAPGKADHSLLFNATPGKKISFEIVTGEKNDTVASGEISSSTSVYKIKGVPISPGKVYKVRLYGEGIEESTVTVPFFPLEFLSTPKEDGGNVTLLTSSTPTNVEVLYGGVQLPRSECKITLEPPGILFPSSNMEKGKEVVVMIYNGENTVNILTYR